MHVKVLRNNFKEAWREGQNSTLLARQKVARSRIWRGGVKHEATRKREKGQTKQPQTGRIAEWEDPLVQGLGIDWRHQRDYCHNVNEWQVLSPHVTSTILAKWRLVKGSGDIKPSGNK